MRAVPLVAALAACAEERPCATVGEAGPAAGPGDGGNVLVIVLDDVGIDQLAPWGLGTHTARTPTIDCLCDRGVRFAQAWASPVCSPSRAELLTGRYGRRYGIGGVLAEDAPPHALPEDEETLAELVARAGYATAWAGKWHLASTGLHDSPSHPNRSGFERFAGSLANLGNAWEEPDDEALDYFRWEQVVDGGRAIVERYATVETVDRAIGFVAEAAAPWLVVVAPNAPHAPLHAPPRRLLSGWRPRETSEPELYRAMLEVVDAELGRLLAAIEPEVLAETTIVLVGDNGTPSHAIGPPLDPDRGKETLFEGGVRVPLVVAGAAARSPGAVVERPVHVVDVLPTVAELVGVLPERPLDGASLLPLLADPRAPGPHETVASFFFGPVGELEPPVLASAIRDEAYKLIVDPSGRIGLFEVGPDAPFDGEDLLRDRAAEHGATVARLEAALADLEDRFQAERP